MTRRLALSLVACTGLGVAVGAAPADAARTLIGPDLSQTAPAELALMDGNDTFWWDGAPGIEVRKQGEIRGIRIKGGTVQTSAQKKAAKRFDANYDITHWVVLRKRGGAWVPVSNSEDVRLPIVGRGGVTASTISTLRQPKDDYRVCAKRGDRVALASVGGYVPGVFDKGLPFQTFARVEGASIQEWFAGGGNNIQLNKTKIRPAARDGVQLQMQAILGTGKDARYTCQTKSEQRRGV